ncbi:AfsR/SARP family transcriptional regulator [Streptacidiphilus fuscans]|uniref:AfsR/SARP family transcriptional regulator n=1 Tax=Streptacidiphilus fuscans TaxID=2789292 RepID=UPI002E27CB8E|nr:BTAD domain-containing putative transcriptional regulator [Streptacidiphilus fuscans]
MALLLEPGRVVPVARLVEITWDDAPPATAAHQIRKIVADLRQRIPGGAAVFVTDGPGYRVAVDDDQVDLSLFGVRLRRAREAVAAGLPGNAVDQLRAALELWRGRLLAGEGGMLLQGAATSLEERRLTAVELLFELQLGLGEAAELVGDLRELARENPLRETLRGQLMLALYRSGRQAEALEEYQRVRTLLAEELGIDPGPELSALHEGILKASPELAAPRQPTPSGPATAEQRALAQSAQAQAQAAPAPCSLPYDVQDFTGRTEELQQLLAAVAEPATQGTPILAIDGMGGSGKTALAVHAAHRLAELYPDGQISVDLHGFTPGQRPREPSEVLDVMLRSLGLPGDRIPDDLLSKIALWRMTTAQRRLLILLDNAADAEQVRPLLPSSPKCMVLITSRIRLVDLDGARALSIGVLSVPDSLALVERTLGAERVAAEPAAAEELAQLCGRLPLALRIATARLGHRPRWTIQYLVDRLSDEARKLDELASRSRGVAATLQLSYLAMDGESRNAFRLLSLHPGDLDVHSAAALLGTPTFEAEELLELLLDAHLLEQHELGRYTFHDLVRSFAHSLCTAETAAEDGLAVGRLLDNYVLAVEAACEVSFPGRVEFGIELPAPTAALPVFASSDAALAWFEREHRNLLAAVRLAARRGLDWHCAYLPRAFASFLHMQGRAEELLEAGQLAVAASRRLGDRLLLRLSLTNLAVALWQLGRVQEGVDALEQALEIAVEIGDRHGEAACRSRLGAFRNSLGRYADGLRDLEAALLLHQALGSPREEAATLISISSVSALLGKYPAAAEAARTSAEINHKLGEVDNEALALVNLANAHLGLGAYDEALAVLANAQELHRSLHRPGNASLVLARLADAHLRAGRPSEAYDYGLRALDLVWTSGSTARRATVENILGRIHQALGEHVQAQTRHGQALRLAEETGFRIEMAYALEGLGSCAEALGESAQAREHRGRADELFAAMGVPEECRRLA